MGERVIKRPKARHADECHALEQLPNVGPAIAADLRRIGVKHPRELAARDAFALYQALCSATGRRQDPCVLDTFMAATDFMRGAAARPWWRYTAQRKLIYGSVRSGGATATPEELAPNAEIERPVSAG